MNACGGSNRGTSMVGVLLQPTRSVIALTIKNIDGLLG